MKKTSLQVLPHFYIRSLTVMLFLFTISVNGWTQLLEIKDVVGWIGTEKAQVIKKIQSMGFVYQGKDEDFLVFDKTYSIGKCHMSIGLKNNKLNVISWNEYVGYAAILYSDVTLSGFSEAESFDKMKGFKNYERGLVLTLIDHSATTNEIIVTIGRMKESGMHKQTKVNDNTTSTGSTKQVTGYTNRPKAVFRSVNTASDSIKSNSGWFAGERKFCGEGDYWYYLVTISDSSITLISYPGTKNDHFKNKNQALYKISGRIEGYKIITNDSPEYKAPRFKYENGILYELNNEGKYIDYRECE
jgi:hypothetical protein